jgi:hypothetical protein
MCIIDGIPIHISCSIIIVLIYIGQLLDEVVRMYASSLVRARCQRQEKRKDADL